MHGLHQDSEDNVSHKKVFDMKHFSFLRMLFPALVLFAAGFSAFADSQITWDEEPQFRVDIDGKLDVSAKIYRPSGNKPYLLLKSEKFKSILLINLSDKSVSEVTESIPARDEYALESKSVPKSKPAGSYSVKSGVTAFKYRGKIVNIKVKETLVGLVTEAIILAHSPEYAVLRDRYKTNAKNIATIKKYSKPVEVVVMFANWCSTCKQPLPKFMKVMRTAQNKNFTIKYIGIAMGGNEPREELDKYGHDYPAFIFYSNGKEIGRIIGDTPGAFERSVADLLIRGK